MTKFEFIQEAALRILSACPEYPNGSIGDKAAELADEVWTHEEKPEPAQEHEPEILKCFSDEESILAVAKEIARIEEEEIAEKNRQLKAKGGWGCYQKAGADIRFINVCRSVYRGQKSINTVKELIDCGRHDFGRRNQMGKLTLNLVDKALENLYNIKAW